MSENRLARVFDYGGSQEAWISAYSNGMGGIKLCLESDDFDKEELMGFTSRPYLYQVFRGRSQEFGNVKYTMGEGGYTTKLEINGKKFGFYVDSIRSVIRKAKKKLRF